MVVLSESADNGKNNNPAQTQTRTRKQLANSMQIIIERAFAALQEVSRGKAECRREGNPLRNVQSVLATAVVSSREEAHTYWGLLRSVQGGK
jgi:hypothetical protein